MAKEIKYTPEQINHFCDLLDEGKSAREAGLSINMPKATASTYAARYRRGDLKRPSLECDKKHDKTEQLKLIDVPDKPDTKKQNIKSDNSVELQMIIKQNNQIIESNNRLVSIVETLVQQQSEVLKTLKEGIYLKSKPTLSTPQIKPSRNGTGTHRQQSYTRLEDEVSEDFIELIPSIIDCDISGYNFHEILDEFASDDLDSGSLRRIQASEEYRTALSQAKRQSLNNISEYQ